MSLLPYALRPSVILRGQVIKRGVIGGNPLLRPLAMLMVGQGVYLRRGALRHGFLKGERYWQVIGVVLIGEGIYKRAVKKQPEHIAVERMRSGQRTQISTTAPQLDLSRRQRRAELKRLTAEALASTSSKRS